MNIIYEVLSGSHAYGLATDQADEDIRGIFLPSAKELLGFGYKETKIMQPDKAYHSLKKYLHLALNANPSILAWLWVGYEFVRIDSWISNTLRANRQKFLSKLVYKTFGGYATSQLRKMEKSYGMDRGYALHGERDASADPYSLKAGYDTKNAMHLIRLLRSGRSLLETCDYELYRTYDRDQLLDIRHGNWQMHTIISEAQDLFLLMDEALVSSPLPDEPDRAWAKQFLFDAHLSILE